VYRLDLLHIVPNVLIQHRHILVSKDMTDIASHGLSPFWPSAGWGPEQPERWLIKLKLMGHYASLYVVSTNVEISKELNPNVPNNCHQFPQWVT